MIEACVCISLARRQDRWDEFTAKLPGDWPFAPVVRLEAVDGLLQQPPRSWTHSAGAWGCRLSHLEVLRRNRGLRDGSLLVLEDDAVFVQEFSHRCTSFLGNLPAGWSVVYLGGRHQRRPVPLTDVVGTVVPTEVRATHAYVVSGRSIAKLYYHISLNDKDEVDVALWKAISTLGMRAYCPGEWLVGQSAGRSDIQCGECSTLDRFWQEVLE